MGTVFFLEGENVLKLIVMIVAQPFYAKNNELYTLNECIIWYLNDNLIKVL